MLGEIKQQEREKVQLSLDFGKRIIKENQELQREKAEKAAGRKLEEKMWVDSLLKQENEEKLRETLEKVPIFSLNFEVFLFFSSF